MSALTTAAAHETARPAEGRGVRLWLYGVAALIFAMILVGGVTRLTDSGLSITEWQPILGAVPPLSEADWQDAFAKYQQIPEYKLVNPGMSLEAFKSIYWWEWAHRFLGRFIGVAFFLPFIFFWLTGRIGRPLMPKLLGIFVLGGLQGGLGWYMVMSGLVDRVDVSQYRLAAHLSLAVLIYGAVLWVAWGAGRQPTDLREAGLGRALLVSAVGLAALVFVQIALGGLVAGLDAGQGYNTWPLMDGALIPDGLGVMRPWYLNLFENALTVQFQHRMVAYAVAVWALAQVWMATGAPNPVRASAGLLALAVLAQIGLGVWTLLAQAPLDLSLAHQAGAIVVFTIALYHLHTLAAVRRGAAAAQTVASA